MTTLSGNASRVVVIGAGPAGLASAIALSQRGFSVTLCDPRWPHLQKACGEGLMPSGVTALEALGVRLAPEQMQPLFGVAFTDGTLRAEGAVDRAQPALLGVRRDRLSAALQARARELGVTCIAARAEDVTLTPASVGYTVNGARHEADFAVAADGLHSSLRRHLRQQVPRKRIRRFGQRQHFACAPWSPFVEVYVARHAEAYVTPVDATSVNVAVLSDETGTSLGTWITRFAPLSRRLGGHAALDRPRGAGPLWQETQEVVVGRLAFVGDAAGYVDAITGEGVSLALASSLLLADTLARGKPLTSYATLRAPLARHYRFHARLLLWLSGWPRMRRVVLFVLARVPRLFDAWLRRSVALDWQTQLQKNARA